MYLKKFSDFLEQLSTNFNYQMQLFRIFAATSEQLFEKLQETFWEISSNLWKEKVWPLGGILSIN